MWSILTLPAFLIVSGCVDTRKVRPLEEERMVQNIPVREAVIIVLTEFELETQLPAGVFVSKVPRSIYLPMAEDDQGVFFKARKSITRSRFPESQSPLVANDMVSTGGILLANDGTGFLWIRVGHSVLVYAEQIPPGKFILARLKPPQQPQE
jgi:hypothetical protein